MSKVETITIDTPSGSSALQIGDGNTATIGLGKSGDTLNVPSGATLDVASGATLDLTGATVTGFTSGISDLSPMFSVRQTGTVNVSDNTYTKVAWNSELVDTDNAFASDKFTVPSGKAGKYFLYVMLLGQGDNNNTMNVYYLNIYKNGSRLAMNEGDYRGYAIRKATQTVTTVQDLAVGDYLEVYVGIDVASGVQASYSGGDFQGMFGGYKIG
tara:strand:- start:619 stop:1257 length:639 start_codon:yes stop_codon:yes gene_type:complete